MPHIEKRGPQRWMAVYKHPDTGKTVSKSFPRKLDAENHLTTTVADQLRGLWVDPRAGRITVEAYAAQWMRERHIRPTTRERYDSYVKLINELGSIPIGDLRPSQLRAWQLSLSERYAVSTANTVRGVFAAMLKTAVADRVIASSPFAGVQALPKPDRVLIRPLPLETVKHIADEITTRYRAAVMVGAGCGLRRGEVFALRVESLNMLRKTLSVDRGLVQLAGQAPTLGPPKTRASVRTVPMPRFVVEELAAHLARWPAGPDGYVFTTSRGSLVARGTFGPAYSAVAPEGSRFHDLRHFYASTLIESGASVKVVQARLGHASALETLDTYGHLWPDSEDSTRDALDAAFKAPSVEKATESG